MVMSVASAISSAMGLSPELPAAVYAVHHPDFGAVKTGICLEPRQRRISVHQRRGWVLLADFGTPTALDASAIERRVLDGLATPVWEATGFGARKIDGLPGHGRIAECRHCGTPRATPSLRFRREGFLTREQMPQGGSSETFDARLVSPGRMQLALYFAEAEQRARYYPDREDDKDAFEARRLRVVRQVEVERLRRRVY